MGLANDVAVYPDPALRADLAGQSAVFKEPGMPKPFIEPYAVFAAQENFRSFSFAKGEFSSIGAGFLGGGRARFCFGFALFGLVA